MKNPELLAVIGEITELTLLLFELLVCTGFDCLGTSKSIGTVVGVLLLLLLLLLVNVSSGLVQSLLQSELLTIGYWCLQSIQQKKKDNR